MKHNAALFVLLLFCLAARFASAQKTVEIVPFEDYQNCLTGFKTNYGSDPGFPAIFSSVRNLYTSIDRYHVKPAGWLVWLGGKAGCLDKYGNWLLQPEFDSVDVCDDYLVIGKAGKFGVYSIKDAIRIPLVYDSVQFFGMYHPDGLFKCSKSGLTGVLTGRGKEFISLKYTDIEVEQVYGQLRTSYVYKATGKYTRIFDSGGALLFDGNYSEVEPVPPAYDKPPVHFFIRTKTGSRSVSDAHGNLLLPETKGDYTTLYTYRDAVTDVSPRFYREVNEIGDWRIRKVSGKKVSGRLNNCHLTGDYFQVFDGDNQWTILDSNLQNVYTPAQRGDLLLTIDSRPYVLGDNYYTVDTSLRNTHNERMKKGGSDPFLSTVYCIGRKKPADLPVTGYDLYRGNGILLGLVDFKTGRKTEICYRYVQQLEGGGKSFFWALQLVDSTDRFPYRADIFDKELNLLRSVRLTEHEKDRLIYRNEQPDYFTKAHSFLDSRHDSRIEFQVTRLFWNDGRELPGSPFEHTVVQAWLNNDSTGTVLLYDEETAHYFFKSMSSVPFRYEGIPFSGFGETSSLPRGLVNGQLKIVPGPNEPVLADSCEDILSVNYDVFVLQKGKVYKYFHPVVPDYYSPRVVPQKERLVLFDARWSGGIQELWITPDVRVDGSGTYTIVRKPDIYCCRSFLLANDTLHVRDTISGKEIALSDVLAYRYESCELVHVKTRNGKWGCFDLERNRWSFEPGYDSIRFCRNSDASFQGVDFFHLVRKNKGDRHFQIVSQKGKEIPDVAIDEIWSDNRAYWYTLTDKKLGILSSGFRWLIQPEFDSIGYLSWDFPFLWKNSQPQFFGQHSGQLIHPLYDKVSFLPYKALLFTKDSGVYMTDYDGNMLVPLTSRREIAKHKDFFEVAYTFRHESGIFGDESDFESYTLDAGKIPEKVRIKMAETYLRNNLCHSQSADSISRFFRLKNHVNSPEADCYIYCSYAGNILTECCSGSCYLPRHFTDIGFTSYRKYRTYFYLGDTLLEIQQFDDLFKEGYAAQVDSLIGAEIMRSQVFGLSCVDLNGAINEFKQNFYLSGSFVTLISESEKEIAISLSELDSILRYPDIIRPFYNDQSNEGRRNKSKIPDYKKRGRKKGYLER